MKNIIILYLHIGKGLVAPAVDAAGLIRIFLVIWTLRLLGIFLVVIAIFGIGIIRVFFELWVLVLFVKVIVVAIVADLLNNKLY